MFDAELLRQVAFEKVEKGRLMCFLLQLPWRAAEEEIAK